MKKICFAVLIVSIFGLVVARGTASRLWRSSEAVAFADKGAQKVFGFGDDAFTERVPRKPLAKPTAPPDLIEANFEAPSNSPRRSDTTQHSVSYPVDGIDFLAGANPTDEEKAKLMTLREKLAELTKSKAELVNEQTLTNEIEALEKQISDLHAAQKLLSAKQVLSGLIEEFPNSPAALRAKRMLEAADAMKPLKPDPASALPTYR